MKHMMTVGVLELAALLLAGTAGMAANTWDAGGGANTDWTYQSVPGTYDNWDDNSLPASGANVTLGTAGSLANLDSSRTVGLLTVNRNGFTLTNSPGASLTLGAGLSFATANVKIAAPLVVNSANTWSMASEYCNGTLSGNVSGTGPVTLSLNKPGTAITLQGNNSGFSGGFTFTPPTGSGGSGLYETPTVNATAANSLGTGQSSVGAKLNMFYTGGALAAAAPALQITRGGGVVLQGTLGANDKFTVRSGGMLVGNATQLGALTLGNNVWLESGAVVGHSALNQATINGLPTNASLRFGVYSTLNSAAATLNAGAGTPWGGLNAGSTYYDSRLSSGTVAINTAGLSEFTFEGINTVVAYAPLYLGNNAAAPTFSLAAGSAIPARVVGGVTIDTTAPSFAAFSKFVVANGTLAVRRNGALAAKPVDLDNGTLYLYAAAAGSPNTAGVVTAAGGSSLAVRRFTAGTPETLTLASLTRIGRSVAMLNDLNNSLGTDERIVVSDTTGLTRGSIVDPWIIRFRDSANGDYLTYGANGFAPATALYTTTFGNGAIVSGVTSVTGSQNADSLRVSTGIANGGSGVINLGVLSDGTQAARAGMISAGGQDNVYPAVNAGASELIIEVNNYNGWMALYGNLTATNGLSMVGSGASIVNDGPKLELRGTANDMRGQISVWSGMLKIGAGNGLADSATVQVSGGGILRIGAVAGNTETIAGLSGNGMVYLDSSRTLRIANTLSPVTAASGSMSVSGAGTLALGDGASAVFTIDLAQTPTNTALLAMSSTPLSLGTGCTVALTLSGVPAQPMTYTLISHGTRNGTFASATVVAPDGVRATLTHETNAIKVTLVKKAQGTVIMCR